MNKLPIKPGETINSLGMLMTFVLMIVIRKYLRKSKSRSKKGLY